MNERCYFKELRLRQFRALAQLLKHDTFEDVGRALGLARASVWRQIRALESHLGRQLLQIDGRHVHLTPAGRMLAELSVPVVDDFEQVLLEFQHRSAERDETLRIATTPLLLAYDLPPAIVALQKKNPHILFHAQTLTSEVCLRMLLADEVDVAVIGEQEKLSSCSGLITERVTAFPFVVLTPPRHPLSRKKRVTLRDLAVYPLILPAPDVWPRQRINAAFQELRVNVAKLKIIMEIVYSRSGFPFVRSGLGVALLTLSPTLIRTEVEALVRSKEMHLIPFQRALGAEEVFFVCKKVRGLRPVIMQFQQELRKMR